MAIRFGTSGWRGIIADEFTFANVRVATQAICLYLREQESLPSANIIIGHDSRFMGEKFAALAAELFSENGFRVLLCGSPTPTPVISHAIRHEKAVGGVNFTASHNPPEYQGIKFSTSILRNKWLSGRNFQSSRFCSNCFQENSRIEFL